MSKPATIKEMQEFFSTPKKPVTTSELIDFKKNDPAGYEEVKDLLGKQLHPTD